MQQQSPEIQALRIQFQKMVTQAPDNQKEAIREIKKFMLDTVKKVEAIRKKTEHSNMDFCNVVLGNQIKDIAGRVVNTYTLVYQDPKASKKFLTLVSKLSLSKMEKPFEKLQKDKTKIAKMTEEESEVYSEKLVAPLDKYKFQLVQKINQITSLLF